MSMNCGDFEVMKERYFASSLPVSFSFDLWLSHMMMAPSSTRHCSKTSLDCFKCHKYLSLAPRCMKITLKTLKIYKSIRRLLSIRITRVVTCKITFINQYDTPRPIIVATPTYLSSAEHNCLSALSSVVSLGQR